MADEKTGFKFWRSYYEALKVMPDDASRGRFVMALTAYVFDDVEPTFSTDMERFGFSLIADQCMESKRLYELSSSSGKRGGRPRKQKEERDPKRGAFKTPKRGAESVSRYVSSSFQEEEEGAAGAGPWGPAPPRLEDLPPIPGQRDTNGGDCE